MDELPDKVIPIEILRINRNIDKRCKCRDRNFIVDPANRSVYCGKCGASVDPYDAIYELAKYPERLQNEIDQLLKQGWQIANYKPFLKVIKRLESECRSGKMLPRCPECGRGIHLEEINGYVSREWADAQRNAENERNEV